MGTFRMDEYVILFCIFFFYYLWVVDTVTTNVLDGLAVCNSFTCTIVAVFVFDHSYSLMHVAVYTSY